MLLKEFFSVPSIEKNEQEHPNYKNQTEKEKLSNDLYWYILDHDRLHKKYVMPIAREMNEQLKAKKELDRTKYTECWMPMVEEGCMDFYKERKMSGNPKKIFDKEMREALCKRLGERHIKDVSKGEYKLGD